MLRILSWRYSDQRVEPRKVNNDLTIFQIWWWWCGDDGNDDEDDEDDDDDAEDKNIEKFHNGLSRRCLYCGVAAGR